MVVSFPQQVAPRAGTHSYETHLQEDLGRRSTRASRPERPRARMAISSIALIEVSYPQKVGCLVGLVLRARQGLGKVVDFLLVLSLQGDLRGMGLVKKGQRH